jgi:hypothetical protein
VEVEKHLGEIIKRKPDRDVGGHIVDYAKVGSRGSFKGQLARIFLGAATGDHL